MTDFLAQARELFPYTQALRRDFHRHPELGFREVRTSGIVAHELEALGLEVTKGIAKTGVVALLEGAHPGPTVLLRFDMDALPIQEETGAEYASQTPGVMHACGHDGHTAIGLTVARMLHACRDHLHGTVKFVFQPAEEGLCGEEMGGARRMIHEGVLENPKPDFALALHLWNEQPLGWIHVAAGPIMASADLFTVRLTGKGGHAAAPHLTVDPIVAAAQIVSTLQSIVSRNVGPRETAVVSVTTIHGGEAFNVIPQEVEMRGTIRTFDPGVRERVLQRFQEIVQGVAQSLGCATQIEVQYVAPATVNDARVAEHVHRAATRLFPDSEIQTDPYVTMGSEDMGFILEQVPGCYYLIGSANQERNLVYGHHHPKFDFDEQALVRGAALMAAAAAEILHPD